MRKLLWIAVALIGAFAVGGIALHRGETINAMWIVVAAGCVYAIGYRFYSAWVAAKRTSGWRSLSAIRRRLGSAASASSASISRMTCQRV